MRFVTLLVLVFSLVINLIMVVPILKMFNGDKTVRENTYSMSGENGQCTAFSVVASSGKIYTLTAKHCDLIVDKNGLVTLFDSKGQITVIKLVAEDSKSDLLLLTSQSKTGLKLAEKSYTNQRIFTVSYNTDATDHRLDGELLNPLRVEIIIFEVKSAFDMARCTQHTNSFIATEERENSKSAVICYQSLIENISTLKVVEGNSGSPVTNLYGELVGVVSAIDDKISTLVTPKDIKEFLKNY